MAIYFFDSSGLVKRYVAEVGTAWVQGLTDPSVNNGIYIGQITGVEVIAGINKRVSQGSTTRADASKAIGEFRLDYARQYNIIEITDLIIASAMNLAETYTLRGYDAVQLATALTINSELLAANAALGTTAPVGPMLTMICSDKNLKTAAAAEGLTVDDANNHP
ncbi:MAG: type II toxin-antitoxin system VapC family toxin [Pyrinomonadaceae bacterium]